MIDLLLQRLSKVVSRGQNRYMACCPAHDDKNPSLAISQLPDGRILLKCFAGCDVMSVMQAVGLSVSDLFPDGGLGHYQSFARLEDDVRKSETDKYFKEKVILILADEDRANGKRLSQADLITERNAYLKLRKLGILEKEAI